MWCEASTPITGGGPRAQEFEIRFAAYVGKQYGFFHQSGSSALLSAVFSTTFKHEGPVIVGSSGFVAAINAVYHNGARPIFLKTDVSTLQASALDYDPVDAEPSSLLVSHFLGNVADTLSTQESVKARYVIEDAGQAHGMEAVPGYNLRGGEMEAVLVLTSLADPPARISARNRTAQMISSVLNSAGNETAVPFSERAKPAWFDVGIILPEEFIQVRDRLVAMLKAEHVPAATYPSLIEIAWVKPWMQDNG